MQISKSRVPTQNRARRGHARGRNAGGGKPVRAKPSDQGDVSEKSRALAEIALHPITTYFNEDGSFDIVRARRRIPESCLKEFVVEETATVDGEGTKTVHRTINIFFRDRVAALRLHEFLASKVVRRTFGGASAG